MQKEFYVDYFERGGESPYFNLCVGFLGDIKKDYDLISSPRSFPELALDLLTHLKETTSSGEYDIYNLGFSNSTQYKLGDVGRGALVEILALHNDLVAPVRRT